MKIRVIALAVLASGLALLNCANEIVVLKGGRSMERSKPYVIRGSQAVMTLKDGTVISVSPADIDKAATAEARKAAAGPAKPAAVEHAASPADAARAQSAAPKASRKFTDRDFAHIDYDEATGEPKAEEKAGEGSLTVTNWDQVAAGGSVTIKGTLRYSGKEPAQNVGLTVSGNDAANKASGTTTADVAAGSLENGATTSFSASLPGTAPFASVRFQPRWSTPAPKEKPAEKKPAAAAPPAKSPEKPAAPEYKASPDYAPPAASAPTTAPNDSHTGYIPGAHVETPPPPPPR